MKGAMHMNKQVIIAQKKDRLATIIEKGKSTQGVIRRLQREIRNLEK